MFSDISAIDDFLAHSRVPETLIIGAWLLFAASVILCKMFGPRFVWLMAVAGITFLVGAFGSNYLRGRVEDQAWAEIDPVLNGTLVSVTVDEKPVPNDGDFIRDLRAMGSHASPNDHSSSLPHRYKVLLKTTSGRLQLDLRRNDRHPTEYWVDYPKYFVSSPIAHMGTATLKTF